MCILTAELPTAAATAAARPASRGGSGGGGVAVALADAARNLGGLVGVRAGLGHHALQHLGGRGGGAAAQASGTLQSSGKTLNKMFGFLVPLGNLEETKNI